MFLLRRYVGYTLRLLRVTKPELDTIILSRFDKVHENYQCDCSVCLFYLLIKIVPLMIKNPNCTHC